MELESIFRMPRVLYEKVNGHVVVGKVYDFFTQQADAAIKNGAPTDLKCLLECTCSPN